MKRPMMWNFIGNCVYMGVQWLLTILVVRLAGYTVSGVYSLALTVTNVFYAIAIAGVRNYQISDLSGKYSDSDYYWLRILTNLIALVLCVGFVLLNRYSVYQSIVILCYMLFKISESFLDVFHGAMQKQWKLELIGKSFLLRAVLTLTAFYAVLRLTGNLLLSVVAMALCSYGAMFLYDVRLGSVRLCAAHKSDWRERILPLFYKILPMAVYCGLFNILGSIPRWSLERQCGEELLGYYASLATPTVILQVVTLYIFSPLVPLFAQYYYDKDIAQFRRLFKKIMILFAVLACGSFLGTLLLGKLFLRILYGSEILQYFNRFYALVACAVLTAFCSFLGAVLTVFRDFKPLLAANILGVAVSLICCLCLMERMEMVGANIAWLVSLMVTTGIMFVFVCLKLRKKNFVSGVSGET